MQVGSMKKFLEALKKANIKNWEAVTDVSTHMYNNQTNSFNLLDEPEEILYNITGSTGGVSSPYTGQVVVKGTDLGDIHEVRFGGELPDVKEFLKAYGFSLSEDQTKILVNIQGNNYRIRPQTGDYTFVKLSDEDIAKLSSEEKSAYEQKLSEWQKNHKMQTAIQMDY